MGDNLITFDEMTALFGRQQAQALLAVIERAADRDATIIPFNPNLRLSEAFRAMEREAA